jgi:hypothetical protein
VPPPEPAHLVPVAWDESTTAFHSTIRSFQPQTKRCPNLRAAGMYTWHLERRPLDKMLPPGVGMRCGVVPRSTALMTNAAANLPVKYLSLDGPWRRLTTSSDGRCHRQRRRRRIPRLPPRAPLMSSARAPCPFGLEKQKHQWRQQQQQALRGCP